jgi:hypothetical protein
VAIAGAAGHGRVEVTHLMVDPDFRWVVGRDIWQRLVKAGERCPA